MGVLSHRANALWSLAGNAGYALGQWALIIVLARSGSLEETGRFALALALTAPIFMAANMRLRMLLATDVAARRPFSAYLLARIASSSLALAAALVVCVLSTSDSQMRLVVAATAAAKFIESVQDMILGLFQRRERMDQAAVSMLASSGLSVFAFGVVYGYSHDLLLACGALALSRLFVLFVYDVPKSMRGADVHGAADEEPASGRQALMLLAAALPLGVAALLDSLSVNAPRYFIGALAGERELGAFAAVVQIALGGFVVVNAIGQSMMPRLAKQFQARDWSAFDATAQRLFGAGAGVGALGLSAAIIAGGPLLALIYGDAFAEAKQLFVIVMAGAAFSYAALALALLLTTMGERRIQPLLYLANIASIVIGCIALAPRLGVEGAALSVLLGHAAQAALSFLWLLKLRRGRAAP